MDYVEDNARRWVKKEEVEVDMLSDWVKSIASLVNRGISILSATMSTRCKSICDFSDIAADLANVHEKSVLHLADKHFMVLCLFAGGGKSYIYMHFVVYGGNSEKPQDSFAFSR